MKMNGDLHERIFVLFKMFLHGLRGYIEDGNVAGKLSVGSRSTFVTVMLHKAARTFVAYATNDIEEYLAEMYVDASNDVRSELTAKRNEIVRLIWNVSASAVATAINSTNKSKLANMLNSSDGAIGELLKMHAGQERYKVKDSSGRTWDSDTYIRLVVKNFAFQTKLIYLLSKIEGDLVEVVYANPEHKNNGLVFSKSGVSGDHPSFNEIKETVFHPNTTAMVRRYVSS